mgnify:FL=1|jgi:ABC-type nitrate/sulfonate/bicarbonate transport system ATPase subunit
MFMVSFKFNNFMFRDLEYVIDPDFSMNSGDFVRFYGANGVGKTTLFNIIAFNQKVKIGKAEEKFSLIEPVDVIYLPQDYNEFIFNARTVKSFIIGYMESYGKFSKKQAEVEVTQFFYDHKKLLELNFTIYKKDGKREEFNLHNFNKMHIDKMSGGQKRILYLIRTFLVLKSVNKSQKFLLMDEPFNDLDQRNKVFALQLIAKIRKSDPSIIIALITHMPIVSGMNRLVRFTHNEGKIEVFDDTKKSKKLLDVCRCLFEESDVNYEV